MFYKYFGHNCDERSTIGDTRTMLKKAPLAVRIFISLVLGIIAGLLLQDHTDFAEDYIKPFGTIS